MGSLRTKKKGRANNTHTQKNTNMRVFLKGRRVHSALPPMRSHHRKPDPARRSQPLAGREPRCAPSLSQKSEGPTSISLLTQILFYYSVFEKLSFFNTYMDPFALNVFLQMRCLHRKAVMWPVNPRAAPRPLSRAPVRDVRPSDFTTGTVWGFALDR